MQKPSSSEHCPPADPDLVDRIFELLRGDPRLPAMPPRVLAQLKAEIRCEFADQVRRTSPQDRADRVHQVLSLFNGRNATSIARQLNISRATVYRYLKQGAARPRGAVIFRVPASDRLTFPGNETPGPIPSAQPSKPDPPDTA